MHKIFKLCGSPSEEFWRRTKLPHATSFKPQSRYKSCLSETFKSFPPSALALVNKLLAIEPEHRGSATLALRSEVCLQSCALTSIHFFFLPRVEIKILLVDVLFRIMLLGIL